jgi:SAM-dependent methyltransferase
MPDFTKRSAEKEILDSKNIPFEEIRKNMQELEFINAKLGGHAITIDGISILVNQLTHKNSGPISICEIGCGGGDNLAAICKWAKKKSIEISCIGIDINPECIQFAKDKNAGLPIKFICADYKEGLVNENKPAIIFSSLFCHHFSDEELTGMMNWMKENSSVGFLINDLHRHPLAYYSIKALVNIFSKSYLVKNDAPVSVLRGFKKNEWENIFRTAGFQADSIEWRWAFRYLILFRHK